MISLVDFQPLSIANINIFHQQPSFEGPVTVYVEEGGWGGGGGGEEGGQCHFRLAFFKQLIAGSTFFLGFSGGLVGAFANGITFTK